MCRLCSSDISDSDFFIVFFVSGRLAAYVVFEFVISHFHKCALGWNVAVSMMNDLKLISMLRSFQGYVTTGLFPECIMQISGRMLPVPW